MTLQSYDEIISYLKKQKRRPNLLLGNGFSMAYNPNIFSYNALHQFIENIEDELLSKLFGIVKTKNFELVMQQLDNFCELIQAFGTDKELLERVQAANAHLKTSLIDAIKVLHPEHVFKISDEESQQCARFLNPYITHGHIFTANYDILLYWVLMRNNMENCDGFGRDREDDPEDHDTDPQYSELRWGKYKEIQNVHYLHGALPLFDTGINIVKEEYDGSYLLENITKRLNVGQYPVFVAAGNGDEKLNHIVHNQYLSFCYDALTKLDGSLVTFGFNFGLYDQHIIQAINQATKLRKIDGKTYKLYSVYIGVYSEADEKHIKSLVDSKKFKCKVNLFDAKSAKVWR